MENIVYDNEKWWQEHGFEWLEEINKRRSTQPLYGIQEVVLAQYFSKLPKDSKVLEFGAGFGRHAKYLSGLNNIEFFAVDQSPTMLDALKIYTEGKVKEENVVLIEPRQNLPYPDNYFDVVYTVSVLIHINPEHIGEIIKELQRVAKHVVLHFENKFTEDSALQFKDHNGCWRHAIQNLYANVEMFNDITGDQTLYIVYLDKNETFKFDIDSVVRNRLDTMGQYLGNGLKVLEGEVGWRQTELEKRENEIKVLEGEVGWRQTELEKRENEIRVLEVNTSRYQTELRQGETTIYELSNNITDLNSRVDALESEKILYTTQVEALKNEINAIYNTNSWKIIKKIKSCRVLRWSGKKVIKFYKKIKKKPTVVTSDEVSKSETKDSIIVHFKQQMQENNKKEVIAITHKYWLGVKNATKELYDNVIEIEELNSYQQVVEIGNEIINDQVKKVIFSGFAAGWNTLCSYIKENNPEIKVIIFWHGNTTHMYEDYSWIRYQEILQLSKDKHIDRIAFAKESMCKVYKHMGLNVGLIKNHVEKENIDEKIMINERFNLDKPIRVGIYSSGGTWNKNAYTQIAAASLFKDTTVSMIPYNERMEIFATQLGMKVSGFKGNVDREDLLKEMKKNDINFYITFSECAPLVPLESLNSGVICLTGNNHHYFRNSELESLLIVDRPDDAVAIYNKAIEALNNRAKIFELYSEWYKVNEIEARKSAKNI